MKISQTKILYPILLDGKAHSTYELVNIIKPGGGLVRLSERIREIQKQYGVVIKSRQDTDNRCMWWYQMEVKGQAKLI
jgi:hypothetical protein